METQNKLIAEFMGVKMSDELYKGHPTFVGTHLKKAGLPFTSIMGNCIDNPPFNSSWDWLMPVIEKIRRELYEIKIECLLDMTTVKIFHNYDNENEISAGYSSEVNNDIKAYYQAVIEFIKWYNLNK